MLPRPHAPGPGQKREVKARHGGRHSPRMFRSSFWNSSRCCRRTCRASPPHRAVCKGRTYRGPGWGAAPAAAPRLGEGRGGRGGRKRTCRTVHRRTSSRLWAAQACRQPRSDFGFGSVPGSDRRSRFMAAAAFPPLPPIGGNGRHHGNRESRGRGGARREDGGRGGTNLIARRSDQSLNQPRNTPSSQRLQSLAPGRAHKNHATP